MHLTSLLIFAAALFVAAGSPGPQRHDHGRRGGRDRGAVVTRHIISMIGAISTLNAGSIRIGQSLALATASSMSFASTIV